MVDTVSAVPPDTGIVADLLRDALRTGQHPRLTIVSNSMSPLLRRGDRVEIASVGSRGPSVGDVVVLEAPGALLTHRLWGFAGRDGQQLVTRGDRILSFDAPVPAERLVGRVRARLGSRRTMTLDRGAGLRLSRLLARLSLLELRFFARLCRQPYLARLPDSEHPIVFGQLPQPGVTPLLRRAFHALSWGLAGWSRLP